MYWHLEGSSGILAAGGATTTTDSETAAAWHTGNFIRSKGEGASAPEAVGAQCAAEQEAAASHTVAAKSDRAHHCRHAAPRP